MLRQIAATAAASSISDITRRAMADLSGQGLEEANETEGLWPRFAGSSLLYGMAAANSQKSLHPSCSSIPLCVLPALHRKAASFQAIIAIMEAVVPTVTRVVKVTIVIVIIVIIMIVRLILQVVVLFGSILNVGVDLLHDILATALLHGFSRSTVFP